jgi:succinate dehydrogenase hydrophobic membrane anchor protein
MTARIFISHASKDLETAQAVCEALERRGFDCWLAARNVGPGENFQEAIVRALRAAQVMVLIFSAHANRSSEIRKELAIAGQNDLAVIPVRVENVLPDDALAYEFATRQWVDAFERRDEAIERLAARIDAIAAGTPEARRLLAGGHAGEGPLTHAAAAAALHGTGPWKRLHRLSGIALYAAMLPLAVWLNALAGGPESDAAARRSLASVPGIAALAVCAAALLGHLACGTRYMIRSIGVPLPRSNPATAWYQRLTAVANVPLTLGFVAIAVKLLRADHAEAVMLLRSPLMAFVPLLFILSVCAHMRIGMEAIVEGAMRGHLWRPLLLMANTFFAVAVGLASVYAVVKLNFGA